MGRLALPAQSRIALDASVVIYSVEKIQPYYDWLAPLWQGAKQGQYSLFGSDLLLLEVLVRPIQAGDHLLETAFRQLLTRSKEVTLVPISHAVLEHATRLRAQHRLKTPDAIHIASAVSAGCTFIVTNDAQWQRVPDVPVVLLPHSP
jgi:predicted nucleic acid-binding protein